MKITPQTAGVGTTGLTGITLLVLFLIISGIGQENRKDK